MRSVINILQNDSALTTLLGGANQIGMNTIGQTKKTPYVVVDLEDIDLTNAFNEESGVDFERITIFSVGALAFSSGSIVGADEISKAVKKALNFVTPGTYDGEVITRCTFERGLQMQEDRVANKPQITKEDEYLLVVRSPPVALPTNLTAVLFGAIQSDLTWVDNTGGDFDLNHIERSLDNDSGFVEIGTTTNATTFKDTTITETDPTTYFYRVRTSKDGEFSAYSNIAFFNTIVGFVSTWDTENAGTSNNDQIELPLESSGVYAFTVSYLGNEIKTITSFSDNVVTFPDGAGVKEIVIEGTIRGFRFNNGGDKLKITNISNWGTLNLGNNNGYFLGCTNIDLIGASGDLDMVGTTSFFRAFRQTSSLSVFPLIDTSLVTDFLECFFVDPALTSFPTLDLSSMTNGTNMFVSTNIGTTSWDALLIATEANNSNPNVVWSGGNAQFTKPASAAATARQALIDDHSWTITDGGATP